MSAGLEINLDECRFDEYYPPPADIGPSPSEPNLHPSLGTASGKKLNALLQSLKARLDKADAIIILPQTVFTRIYPEFSRLLPFMITAAINLVYWCDAETRLNILDWTVPAVRDLYSKWASHAYVFVLAAHTVDYTHHELEPGESIHHMVVQLRLNQVFRGIHPATDEDSDTSNHYWHLRRVR